MFSLSVLRMLADKLRPLLFNARVMKGGVNVFNSTWYAGYVGCLTCMKKGGFSITVNTRFDLNFDKGLINWLEVRTSTRLPRFGHRSSSV